MIRRARVGELAHLSNLAFRSKASWGYASDFMERCREELTLTEDALPKTFVREIDQTIVGFYTLEHVSAERVELGHLFVEPAEKRRGHGLHLFRDAMKRALEAGYRTLVIQGDPHATSFYLAAGAKPAGERPSSSIPGRMLPLFEVDLSRP